MGSHVGQPKHGECSANARTVQGAGGRPEDFWRGLRSASPLEGAGLYVHVPFCFHKCHYCDFYSIVDERDRQEAFTTRMIDELQAVASLAPFSPRTIFVGGGTPTLLRTDLWRKLLDAMHETLDGAHVTEFTIEANPETVTEPLLRVLVDGGVNRMSIGAQSFNTRHLKTLERWHDPANVGRAATLARDAGIGNINIDLIFGVPGQSIDDWLIDLDHALALGPDHVSCYALTYEPNTPLTRKRDLGRLEPIDEEREAAMFEATIDTLTDAGYGQYEVSNFARPGRQCEHNLIYWRNGDWLALGPSASGHVAGVRWKNVPHLGVYLVGRGPSPVQDVERLPGDGVIGERLMLGLRLLDGVENGWVDTAVGPERRRLLDGFADAGLLERTSTHTRLTRRGLMFADAVLSELVA